MVFLKLCGRAGRSGLSARAHLFFPNQKKEYKDERLREYVECGENCRRGVLLRGMGGDFVSANGAEMCCDVCTPTAIEGSLDILQPGPCSHAPPRKQIRHIYLMN